MSACGFVRREYPDLADGALGVAAILDERAGRNGGGHDDAIALVADLRAGRERLALAVHLDDVLLDVAKLAALRIGGNGAQLRHCRAGDEYGDERESSHAIGGLEGKWWRIRDSNPGHTDYDSAALTS